jgi:hypothetical protein
LSDNKIGDYGVAACLSIATHCDLPLSAIRSGETTMHQLQPTVWQWYLQRDTGIRFEVIDVDDEEQIVEVQDEDGVMSHIDLDAWFNESLEETDEPQEHLVMSNGMFDPEDEPLIEANTANQDFYSEEITEHRTH